MNYSHNLPPDMWPDLALLLLLICLIALLVGYAHVSRAQARAMNTAVTLVDSTYQQTWTGHPELRMYAWMQTAHKLAGHPNKHVKSVLKMRISALQRSARPNRIMRKPAAWGQSGYRMLTTKPTI